MKEPIRFEAWLRPMVWGGSKIWSFKGLEKPVEGIGESWEISAVPGHESVVCEGPLKGRNLTELVKEYKGALVGEHVYERFGDLFPLLIKFIDALSDLSIQVHPDDALAQKRHGEPFGKTEMWYVIGADKGAFLYSGLKESIGPDDYVRLVEENRITDVLAKHEIEPGEVFFLPAGRVHAIGSGSFIAEIQQTSDLTYRIYDYGRLGMDGKPRQLHTELAKDAIDYKVYDRYTVDYAPVPEGSAGLVDCEYFKTDLLSVGSAEAEGTVTIPVAANDSFMILICTEGSGTVTVAGEEAAPLKKGQSLLIPAGAESVALKGSLTVLSTHC